MLESYTSQQQRAPLPQNAAQNCAFPSHKGARTPHKNRDTPPPLKTKMEADVYQGLTRADVASSSSNKLGFRSSALHGERVHTKPGMAKGISFRQAIKVEHTQTKSID